MDGRSPEPDDIGDDDREAGFSLIEVLVTVIIMGLGFVAILAAMATTASSAGLHRTQAVAELEVRRYAELIQAKHPYSETGYTASDVGYTPVTTSWFAFTADPASVSCTDDAGTAVASCPADVELVNVVVRSTVPDDRVIERVQILKRRTP